jgi:hypothetical protein
MQCSRPSAYSTTSANGFPSLFALLAQGIVLSLKIAAFGIPPRPAPGDPSRFDQVLEHLPDHLLRTPVGVVGTGIDQVDAAGQGFFECFRMGGHAGIDPVTAESGSADPEAGFPERSERISGKRSASLLRSVRRGISRRSSGPILWFCILKGIINSGAHDLKTDTVDSKAAERPDTGVITGIAGVGIDELFFPASGQGFPLGLQFAQQLRQRPRFGGRCQCRPQGLLHAGFPAKGHESVKLVFGNAGNDDGPGKIRSHACAAPIRQGDQVGKGGLLMGFVGPEKADMS